MRALLLSLLAAFSVTLPALAQTTTVSGQVTYRERIALPVPAELVVALVELETGTEITSATAPIPERGQVPLAYTLNLRQLPPPEKQYGLIAKILSGGTAVFQNFDPAPLDPAAGIPVTIFVHSVGTAQPVIEQPQMVITEPVSSAPSSLLNTNWTVMKIGGIAIEAPRKPSIGFDQDSRVYGTGGCNRYFTDAQISDHAITFGVGGATKMACDVQTMQRESDFFAALAEIIRFDIRDNILYLYNTAGVAALELTPASN